MYKITYCVIFQSEAVSRAVWNSEWYECKPDVSKMLLIMMIRAQKPLTMSVGRFYVMSNETALGVSVFVITNISQWYFQKLLSF